MKSRFKTEVPPLQTMYWPCVKPADPRERDALCSPVVDSGSADIHARLAKVYPYYFGYKDSPLFLGADRDLELRLTAVRMQLEDIMLSCPPLARARFTGRCVNQASLVAALSELVQSNPGVKHEFFNYCAERASRSALQRVAWNEVCRNEVVDDEVALMIPGLTGLIKAAVALNLADEMGHGTLRNQHTYWLRQQLAADNDIVRFQNYRSTRAWYLHIPSNVFNSLLLRPGYRWAAFGHFLVTESWVAPHFTKLIKGFERVGYPTDLTYFRAHEKLDRLHGSELLEALRWQSPELTLRQIQLIEWGAELAVIAGTEYFTYFLEEICALDQGIIPVVS